MNYTIMIQAERIANVIPQGGTQVTPTINSTTTAPSTTSSTSIPSTSTTAVPGLQD